MFQSFFAVNCHRGSSRLARLAAAAQTPWAASLASSARLAAAAAQTAGLVLVVAAASLGSASAAEKIKLEKLDDLPPRDYLITGKATALLSDDAALAKLADEVQADLEGILEKYEIPDPKTTQNFTSTLATVAFLEKRFPDYLALQEKVVALEDKEALRLTTGLFGKAYIRANAAVSPPTMDAIRAELTTLVNPLPFAVVEPVLNQAKGSMEMISTNLIEGSIESTIQPALDQNQGKIGRDGAMGLVRAAYTIRYVLPHKDLLAGVYSEYLTKNKKETPEIWSARDVDLSTEKNLSPVVLAVWDSGVDVEIFKSQLWTNPKEVAGNGTDDDGNGFIDDVNGIAHDLYAKRVPELLYPIGDVGTERPRLQKMSKGLGDISFGVESPEATELKKMMSTLEKDKVKPLMEDLQKYGGYSHGTHVAGIAMAKNPAARLLVARATYPHTIIPPTPNVEQSRADSTRFVDCIDYFKKSGVRAVNMSWGGSVADVEGALEANGVGGTAEERKAFARRLFNMEKEGLEKAIAGAPGILFVAAAGNSDANVDFEEFYPSSIDAPNMMTVGAVDASGAETSFTSFGDVDVYANGFEVVSYVPGGDRIPFNGTSMSAPQVVNLVGKLLAVNPKLTPEELRAIVIETADVTKSGERTIRLMNPKAALARVKARG